MPYNRRFSWRQTHFDGLEPTLKLVCKYQKPAVLFVCGIGAGQIAAEVRASNVIVDGKTLSIYCTYSLSRELVEFSSAQTRMPQFAFFFAA